MKFHRPGLTLVLALLAGAPCNAQSVMTGSVAAGVYNVHGDLLIYNVDVHPGPHGETSLTVVVTDGNIDVGQANTFGVHAAGGDGKDGADGFQDDTRSWQPSAGGTGGGGLGVFLQTLRTPTGNSACHIFVNQSIDCRGGNGGRGGNGADGFLSAGCGIFDGQSGASSGFGGPGGAVTIDGAGDISIIATLDVSGGNGGRGGSAGNGFLGQAGYARAGGDGGSAGKISVAHNGNAPKTAKCGVNLHANSSNVGALLANGGSGGTAGSGNTGNGFATPGAAGGAGGLAGAVGIKVFDYSMLSEATAVGSALSASGGAGGLGGDGGAGNNALGFTLPQPCTGCVNVSGSEGADAGQGGGGGLGGIIAITVPGGAASIGALCSVSTNGGNGAMSGRNGQGGNMQAACDIVECEARKAYRAGAIPASGNGAPAGPIGVECKTLILAANSQGLGLMFAHGGNAAPGTNALTAGTYCDCQDQKQSVEGAQGGLAGLAGSGGRIKLTLSYLVASLSQFDTCGGSAGLGGNGGPGKPGGAAGLGTASGPSEAVYVNGTAQPNSCHGSLGSDGQSGQTISGNCQGG